jgi:hypothetical protein
MSRSHAHQPLFFPRGIAAANTAALKHPIAVYWLAAGILGAAFFSLLPAVWDVVDYVRFRDAPGAVFVARWALLLLLLGGVQAAYGVYLMLLTDWTSVWVVTLMCLTMAGLYAMGLAVVLVSDPAGWLVGPGGLQLADKLPRGQAALWCICMISLSTVLAFFAGRLSFQWRRQEMVRRSAGI